MSLVHACLFFDTSLSFGSGRKNERFSVILVISFGLRGFFFGSGLGLG